MFSIVTLYIVSIMLTLQPIAPWKDRYVEIANEIQVGAEREPVFSGAYGVQRTLALDIAVAWFESRFNPDAIGDNGRARGLYQVHYHGPDEPVREQTERANRMMRASFKVCARRAIEERLGWYAAGGNGCERGLKHSRHRMGLAEKLFKTYWKEGV